MGQNVRVGAYRVDSLAPDAATRRRVFDFAQELGATTIVVPGNAHLTGLDTLGEEFRINVAVLDSSAATLKAMEGRSKRLGIGIDTCVGAGRHQRARPDCTPESRLLYVNLRDRSGRGATATNVLLGKGVGNLSEFFSELQRQNVRGLAMTIDTAGVVKAPADLFTAVAAFESDGPTRVCGPLHRVRAHAADPVDLVTPSRGETISPAEMDRRAEEIRAKIDAAIPNKPIAPPKRARKLLVIESLKGCRTTPSR